MTPIIISFGILTVGFGLGSALVCIDAYIMEAPVVAHLILKHKISRVLSDPLFPSPKVVAWRAMWWEI